MKCKSYEPGFCATIKLLLPCPDEYRGSHFSGSGNSVQLFKKNIILFNLHSFGVLSCRGTRHLKGSSLLDFSAACTERSECIGMTRLRKVEHSSLIGITALCKLKLYPFSKTQIKKLLPSRIHAAEVCDATKADSSNAAD